MEDVACRERLVGFCRHVHLIFGRGLVSSHVEVCIDLWARACFFTCRCCCTLREASLGVVDVHIWYLGKGFFLHVWKMLHIGRG